MKKQALLVIVLLLLSSIGFAQTTGKIAGKVTDATSEEALIGANVLIEGTSFGAAAGLNGEFFIINISPGVYTLRVQMMGYETVLYQDVQVSVNRTTDVHIQMKPTVIEGEVVVVQAEKVAIKKDQTSTVRNVSSEQMEMLPVENVGQVVAMQAGVVNGHFRGGRLNEVAYLIDGVEVTESFGGAGRAVDLEPEAVQDLEVITGTFNAEYGKAMSGIVNAVTKGGDVKFHGSFSANLAEFLTPNDHIFIGMKEMDPTRNQDYKFQLSGPIWGNKITFFTNVRYQNNKNHLFGVRRFEVDDFSDYSGNTSESWYSEANGDSDYVSMNGSKNTSFMGKLTASPFTNFRISMLYTKNTDEWNGYDHGYKYNPDGTGTTFRTTDMYSLNINHMLSPKLFYELKLSQVDSYYGWYLFKSATDS